MPTRAQHPTDAPDDRRGIPGFGHEEPTTKDLVARWLGERTSGDPQMRGAAERRNAAIGEVPRAVPAPDATELLAQQHNRITAMVKQLKAVPTTAQGGTAAHSARRQAAVEKISVALAQHELSEREHLWPVVRRVLPNGDQVAEQGLRHTATETLAAFGSVAPAGQAYDDLVEQLVTRLRQHVAFGDMVFAQLRAAMPQGDRELLGRRLGPAGQGAGESPARGGPEDREP